MVKLKVGAVILAVAVGIILLLFAVTGRRLTPALLPVPQQLQLARGEFSLDRNSQILVDSPSSFEGQFLAKQLRAATGYELPMRTPPPGPPPRGAIVLTDQKLEGKFDRENYTLEVTPEAVMLRAPSSTGLFCGIQTLLQFFPPAIFSERSVAERVWKIPCAKVSDAPRFRWRGVMLDVSRHFFKAEEIKQLLDAMALHKLNVFHWHLTDDQGWRIEIKKYPRLTEVGAWRKRIGFNLDPKSSTAYDSAGQYGGFYTQAQVREIVAYAQARHILVVPEIEMPGHSSAALAGYPEYSCSGGPYTTDMSQALSAGVYCAGNDSTFQFLEDVLSEVVELFPGPFIHIGGDEVPKLNWRNCPRCQSRIKNEGLGSEQELESYFIKRIERFVQLHGKRLAGWSEIQKDDLSQSSVVMDWIGGGPAAARTGHDVVMSPEDYCYLNFYQSKDRSHEPPAAGAYLPLKKVYFFEPIPPGLMPDAQAHILGAQGNIWTEYIASLGQVEYMAFPRLCALSEVLWSPKNSRNWPDFLRRLEVQERRLDQVQINYRRNR